MSAFKKLAPKVLSCITISAVFIISIIMLFNVKKINKEIQKNLLEQANKIVNENIISKNLVQEKLVKDDSIFKNQENLISKNLNKNNDVIGKIIIPKINVLAPIKEGTNKDVLKVAVGHFPSTAYFNGNVCLASHNRGSYAHYFKDLNKLKINDEIKYQTEIGTRLYLVSNIKEVPETDILCLQNSDKNILTLLTCITEKRDKRLCVVATEK